MDPAMIDDDMDDSEIEEIMRNDESMHGAFPLLGASRMGSPESSALSPRSDNDPFRLPIDYIYT
jgi:hypothetical protein